MLLIYGKQTKNMKSSMKHQLSIMFIILFMSPPLSHINLIFTLHNFYLKSKLNGLIDILNLKSNSERYNSEVDKNTKEVNEIPNRYLVKNTYVNPVRKMKHFPPANKEWVNSIYTYNDTVKNFPVLDNLLYKLIRGYFNLYNNKIRAKIRKHGSRRFEIRKSRRLMNKIFFGKPELKHTNNSVIITVYLYNADKKYLINKIKKIPAIYKLNTLVKSNKLSKQKMLSLSYINKAKALYVKKTNSVGLRIMSKLNNHKNKFSVIKTHNSSSKRLFNINKYNKHFMKSYIKKFLRKETVSTFYKQMLIFNKNKFEKKYVSFLVNHVKNMYNKKVEFNFVSLKHIYLDSYIFSTALVTKLKRLAKMKKSYLKGLKQFLSMFKIPRINSLHVYNEIFNRQMINQNINIDNAMTKFDLNFNINNVKLDVLDDTLSFANSVADNLLGKNKTLSSICHISTLTEAFGATKYKIINGVRLEIAGRFTKRSSAARSVFKIRNKGSIKNKDSSYKGLPAVLLKGYAKSNLQYSNMHSKVRGGSFGIKGWLSGT